MDWFVGTLLVLFGVVLGMGGAYFAYVLPIWKDYRRIVERMYRMKKQGFVPQFDVEQTKEIDPSEDIPEY